MTSLTGAPMGKFGRFIITTAEVMMIIIVVLLTIGSAISGATGMQASLGGQFWILGALIGGVGGYVGAAIFAAGFFLLMEIAENTRRIP